MILSDPARLTAANYSFLQRYVYSASGIVLDESKQYLLEARLLPLAQKSGAASLNGLSELLLARPADPLGTLVVEAMTTNETLFFRDAAFFEVVRTHLLGEIFAAARAARRKVRLWSAAASTGQEAYSLAMLLLEAGYTSTEVEIVGTDLSSAVLERARTGSYSQFEVNRGLVPALLAKYFAANGREWRIHEAARRMVHFEQMDLRGSLAHLGRFDLVLCRNVLIYFDQQTKDRILDNMHAALHPGGLLTLGYAEMLRHGHSGLARRAVGSCIFYAR